MEKKKICIAIDGPAAAGKSTVAKIVADQLSYIYIDTGAMYRAITYKAIKENIDVDDDTALKTLATDTVIELKPSEQGQLVFVDGEDVTRVIRDSKVNRLVSTIATKQEVRAALNEQQKAYSEVGGIVMDGRDIGTSVLPDAELKIFMVASVDIRADRRHKENLEKGFESDLEALKKEIAMRDQQDSEREISPLVKADDAIEIDTSYLDIQEVAQEILRLADERIQSL